MIYLTNRKLQVKINNELSDKKTLTPKVEYYRQFRLKSPVN